MRSVAVIFAGVWFAQVYGPPFSFAAKICVKGANTWIIIPVAREKLLDITALSVFWIFVLFFEPADYFVNLLIILVQQIKFVYLFVENEAMEIGINAFGVRGHKSKKAWNDWLSSVVFNWYFARENEL